MIDTYKIVIHKIERSVYTIFHEICLKYKIELWDLKKVDDLTVEG